RNPGAAREHQYRAVGNGKTVQQKILRGADHAHDQHFRLSHNFQGKGPNDMSLLDVVQDEEKKEDRTMQGVALAEVTNNQDPNQWGRVKVKYRWRENSPESDWARIAALAGGKDRGTLWLPEVGDEVLVAFDKGDIDHPFVLGGLWNGVDVPPEKNADGKNDTKLIRTRSGHQVKYFDKQGEESIEIKTQ